MSRLMSKILQKRLSELEAANLTLETALARETDGRKSLAEANTGLRQRLDIAERHVSHLDEAENELIEVKGEVIRLQLRLVAADDAIVFWQRKAEQIATAYPRDDGGLEAVRLLGNPR